jgi:hypothetical protein
MNHSKRSATLFATAIGGALLVSAVFGVAIKSSVIGRESGSPASSAQVAALEDGYASIEELEAATASYVECLEDAGATVALVPGRGLRQTRFTAAFPDADRAPDEAAFRSAQSKSTACDETHVETLRNAWTVGQPVPSAETLQDLADRMSSCLLQGGVALERANARVGLAVFGTYSPSQPTVSAGQNRFAYLECALHIEAETGLLSPSPSVEPDPQN